MPGIRSRGAVCQAAGAVARNGGNATKRNPPARLARQEVSSAAATKCVLRNSELKGNYSGQLVCKLARGSAPENGPPKSTRRRGPAATRRTSTTRQLSPPPPPPKPPPQPSVPAPDNASTQSAPANQSQDSVCSLPAGTADEVLPDRPPAVFGPTPPPLQGTETGPEEPQGCQNCRRLSSTAASQTNVSPARSILAASYSPATSQNDMATHRPSGSDSDRQDQDWGIP
ncbi:hypothetical protein NW754_011231 [Fusarium falciforme]|nr:hypothetical protein NW754_011231 [Fusarium falciforme]